MSSSHFEIKRADGKTIVSDELINVVFRRKHILTEVPNINIVDRREWFYSTNFSWWVCDIPLNDGENFVALSTDQTNAKYNVGTFYFTNNNKRYIRVNVEIKDSEKNTLSLSQLTVYIFSSGEIPTSNSGLELYSDSGSVIFSSTYPPARIVANAIVPNVPIENTEDEEYWENGIDYNIPTGKKYAVGSPFSGMGVFEEDELEWNKYSYMMFYIEKSKINVHLTIWNFYYTRGADYFFPITPYSYGFVVDVTNL